MEKFDRNGGLSSGFKMLLYYLKYIKDDYEKMEEWRFDLFFLDYGFIVFYDISIFYEK